MFTNNFNNNTIIYTQALAFTLNVHSKDSHPSLEVSEISNVENDLINKGFVQTVISKGHQFDIGDKIKWSLYKDAYRISMAVQNEVIFHQTKVNS